MSSPTVTLERILAVYPVVKELGGPIWRWYLRYRLRRALRELGMAAEEAKQTLRELEAKYPHTFD